LGEKERRLIKNYLRSGEKSRGDIITLFRGEVSERTIDRDLEKLCKLREIEKRKDRGRHVWFRLPREKVVPDSPPYDEAPRALVDQRFAELEQVLAIEGDAEIHRWVSKLADEGVEWAKMELELGIPSRLVLPMLRSHIASQFADLCSRYKNVAYSPKVVRRFFKILDRSEDLPEMRTLVVGALAFLVRRSLVGKEDPMILPEARERLDALAKVCLEEEASISLSMLFNIRDISKTRAKELFIEMVGMEKYPIDDLVSYALSLWREDFGNLKWKLDKLYERSDHLSKLRIEEFKRKLEQALKLR